VVQRHGTRDEQQAETGQQKEKKPEWAKAFHALRFAGLFVKSSMRRYNTNAAKANQILRNPAFQPLQLRQPPRDFLGVGVVVGTAAVALSLRHGIAA
jgi:hypothetical protein